MPTKFTWLIPDHLVPFTEKFLAVKMLSLPGLKYLSAFLKESQNNTKLSLVVGDFWEVQFRITDPKGSTFDSRTFRITTDPEEVMNVAKDLITGIFLVIENDLEFTRKNMIPFLEMMRKELHSLNRD